MSMPNIPDITPEIAIDRDEAITLLLASIAMEEMGLAHILNAEGEKLQYVLGLDSNCSSHDILAVNESIERVIRSVTRLQIILQEKLENVIRLLPRDPKPWPPCPPKPEQCCRLIGCGSGWIRNQLDDLYKANVTLEADCKCDNIKEGSYPLKYTIVKCGKACDFTAVLIPLFKGLEIKCPEYNKAQLFLMTGKAVMCIRGFKGSTKQAIVDFTLKVWDSGSKQEFQVITRSNEDDLFNHNSGVVIATKSSLKIIKQ